jgi:hypothetical protein
MVIVLTLRGLASDLLSRKESLKAQFVYSMFMNFSLNLLSLWLKI